MVTQGFELFRDWLATQTISATAPSPPLHVVVDQSFGDYIVQGVVALFSVLVGAVVAIRTTNASTRAQATLTAQSLQWDDQRLVRELGEARAAERKRQRRADRNHATEQAFLLVADTQALVVSMMMSKYSTSEMLPHVRQHRSNFDRLTWFDRRYRLGLKTEIENFREATRGVIAHLDQLNSTSWLPKQAAELHGLEPEVLQNVQAAGRTLREVLVARGQGKRRTVEAVDPTPNLPPRVSDQ